jgi:hypothetical protein
MDQMEVVALDLKSKKVLQDMYDLCEEVGYRHKKEILSDAMGQHFVLRAADERFIAHSHAFQSSNFCGIYNKVTDKCVAVAEYIIRPHFADINITNIMVAQPFRRRGLCKRMLDYIVSSQNVISMLSLFAECHEKSEEAQKCL